MNAAEWMLDATHHIPYLTNLALSAQPLRKNLSEQMYCNK